MLDVRFDGASILAAVIVEAEAAAILCAPDGCGHGSLPFWPVAMSEEPHGLPATWTDTADAFDVQPEVE